MITLSKLPTFNPRQRSGISFLSPCHLNGNMIFWTSYVVVSVKLRAIMSLYRLWFRLLTQRYLCGNRPLCFCHVVSFELRCDAIYIMFDGINDNSLRVLTCVSPGCPGEPRQVPQRVVLSLRGLPCRGRHGLADWPRAHGVLHRMLWRVRLDITSSRCFLLIISLGVFRTNSKCFMWGWWLNPFSYGLATSTPAIFIMRDYFLTT
jgi:hypothetical protein